MRALIDLTRLAYGVGRVPGVLSIRWFAMICGGGGVDLDIDQ